MFGQQLINGLLLGSIYSLLAIGYSLIIALLDKINLAHGCVLMFATFTAYSLAVKGFSFFVVLPVAMLTGMVLSYIVERACFRPLSKGGILPPIVSTIAASNLLQNVSTEIWGAEPQRFPTFVGGSNIYLGKLLLSPVQIVVLCTSFILMFILDFIVNHTKIGRALRTTSESSEVASILGVEPKRIIVYAFLLSGTLAGAAGVMTAIALSQINAFIGVMLGLKALVAMVIGGVGSIRGAMAGGLLLGVVEVFGVAYMGASYREIIVFGLLLLLLWFRPGGLFQRQVALERF